MPKEYNRRSGQYVRLPKFDRFEALPEHKPVFCGNCGNVMHKYHCGTMLTTNICPFGHEIVFESPSHQRVVDLKYLFTHEEQEHVRDSLDS